MKGVKREMGWIIFERAALGCATCTHPTSPPPPLWYYSQYPSLTSRSSLDPGKQGPYPSPMRQGHLILECLPQFV